MPNIRPSVEWNKPELIPSVEKGEMQLFWIAVLSQWNPDQEPKQHVFLAHYVNKPLELDEDGESILPDPFEDCDGDYVSAVGWHDEHNHPDFNGYYEPITFNEQYKLLGWAEYLPPEFTGAE